jgi:hypothetical protein
LFTQGPAPAGGRRPAARVELLILMSAQLGEFPLTKYQQPTLFQRDHATIMLCPDTDTKRVSEWRCVSELLHVTDSEARFRLSRDAFERSA